MCFSSGPWHSLFSVNSTAFMQARGITSSVLALKANTAPNTTTPAAMCLVLAIFVNSFPTLDQNPAKLCHPEQSRGTLRFPDQQKKRPAGAPDFTYFSTLPISIQPPTEN